MKNDITALFEEASAQRAHAKFQREQANKDEASARSAVSTIQKELQGGALVSGDPDRSLMIELFGFGFTYAEKYWQDLKAQLDAHPHELIMIMGVKEGRRTRNVIVSPRDPFDPIFGHLSKEYTLYLVKPFIYDIEVRRIDDKTELAFLAEGERYAKLVFGGMTTTKEEIEGKHVPCPFFQYVAGKLNEYERRSVSSVNSLLGVNDAFAFAQEVDIVVGNEAIISWFNQDYERSSKIVLLLEAAHNLEVELMIEEHISPCCHHQLTHKLEMLRSEIPELNKSLLRLEVEYSCAEQDEARALQTGEEVAVAMKNKTRRFSTLIEAARKKLRDKIREFKTISSSNEFDDL